MMRPSGNDTVVLQISVVRGFWRVLEAPFFRLTFCLILTPFSGLEIGNSTDCPQIFWMTKAPSVVLHLFIFLPLVGTAFYYTTHYQMISFLLSACPLLNLDSADPRRAWLSTTDLDNRLTERFCRWIHTLEKKRCAHPKMLLCCDGTQSQLGRVVIGEECLCVCVYVWQPMTWDKRETGMLLLVLLLYSLDVIYATWLLITNWIIIRIYWRECSGF